MLICIMFYIYEYIYSFSSGNSKAFSNFLYALNQNGKKLVSSNLLEKKKSNLDGTFSETSDWARIQSQQYLYKAKLCTAYQQRSHGDEREGMHASSWQT